MSTTTQHTTVRSGGISFSGLLTVLFIGLKLTGYIDWSWLWVLAPMWISLALFLGVLLAVLVFGMVIAGIVYLMERE